MSDGQSSGDHTFYNLAIEVLAEIAADRRVAAETRLRAVEYLRETANGSRF